MNHRQLSESLIDELVGSLGLPRTRLTHGIFWMLFRNITNRLADLGIPFDQKVAAEGLPEASRWCLGHFCQGIQSAGLENIPPQGPLLVASNHPGAYDALIAFSMVNRQDIRWVSSEIPFLSLLFNTRKHIIFASRSSMANRFSVLRDALRHLQSQGTLVFFGAGHREPDPAVYPGAFQSIAEWLKVMEIFMTKVENVRFLPVIISGVVAPQWARSPFTHLRRKQIDQHRLAEFGQVISQLLRPGRMFVKPAISFGAAATLQEIRQKMRNGSIMNEMLFRMKEQLSSHLHLFGIVPPV